LCEQVAPNYGIGKAINRETSSLVDPIIGIVDVKFDEEPLNGDEWLHIMQQKEHIDMLLFGERNPHVIGRKVEDNMFVETKVCNRSKNENYDAMTEQKKVEKEEVEHEALTEEHNEDIFYIDFECAGK